MFGRAFEAPWSAYCWHMNYKEYLSRTFPLLARLYGEVRLYSLRNKTTREAFTVIYKNNYWKSSASCSGLGSTLESTVNIRREIPKLVRDLKINTFLDLPCGDYHWMKEVDLPVTQYIGGDIVSDLIEQNKLKYSNDGVSFVTLNLTEDKLPNSEMILCRDCLVHLSFDDIHEAFENIKRSEIKYILTTTFPDLISNEDIITGRWRELNLEKPPFALPKPILLIEENETKPGHRKCLGMWLTKDLIVH